MSASNAHRRFIGAIALMLFALPACNDETTFLAVVENGGRHIELVTPTEMHVGERFNVTVRTPGGGCLYAGDTVVVTEGPDTVILPYDVHVADGDCPLVLRHLDHVVTLRFDTAGTKTIRVRGQLADQVPPLEPGEVIDTLFTLDVN